MRNLQKVAFKQSTLYLATQVMNEALRACIHKRNKSL